MIKIYTDGACKGNPGPGGWGALIINNNVKKEIYGGENETTNNRMELSAVIEALKFIDEPKCSLLIYTDSTYVLKGITEWVNKWKKKNWLSSSKKPVKNKDLWIILDSLVLLHKIEWIWVKGHSGHFENDRADFLANLGVGEASK
ncbi:ribonuclease HI [Methylophilaceae bacterium]|jgi:ribonuclease HI|nr:ribonuclease HI [Methylophilaceae bacterium]|tara:strand:- start:509 stop:943 length:435 start_codon:yes stop_codon:yes gene_type:complete